MSGDRLRASLLFAALGACVVLVDLLGLAGSLAGLAAMALGALLSRGAPGGAAPGADVNWRRFLVAGTALAAAGIGLSELVEAFGVLTAVGGGLVLIGAVLGWP